MSSLVNKFKARGEAPARKSGLAELMDTAVPDTDAVIVPIGQIEVREQGRKTNGFEPVSIQGLADNIRHHRLKMALVVKKLGPNRYLLIDGERRLRALKLLGIENVPCRISDAEHHPWEIKLTQISTNEQRENLNAVELAEEYKSILDDSKMTRQELSTRMGVNEVKISKVLSLLEAPKDVRQAILDGALPATSYYNNKRLYRNGLPDGFIVAPASVEVPDPNEPNRAHSSGKRAGEGRATKKRARAQTIPLSFDVASKMLDILQVLAKRQKVKPIVVVGSLTPKHLQTLLMNHIPEIHKKVS